MSTTTPAIPQHPCPSNYTYHSTRTHGNKRNHHCTPSRPPHTEQPSRTTTSSPGSNNLYTWSREPNTTVGSNRQHGYQHPASTTAVCPYGNRPCTQNSCNLATTDSLTHTWPLDRGFPASTDSIWSTGTLTQCILENTMMVTPLLILGSCQGNLHALMLAAPNCPQFITFDKASARDPINNRKPALSVIVTLAKLN